MRGFTAFYTGILVLSLFLLFSGAAARAQESTAPSAAAPVQPAPKAPTVQELQKPPPAKSAAPATNPYAKVSDELLQEADDFLKSCESDVNMTQYYSCDCMAMRYLDSRIKDPKATRTKIIQAISKECMDATEAAGYEYEICIGNAPMLPLNMTPEEYCTCYANTYAKLFQTLKANPNSKNFVEFQTQAHLTCTDPSLAKRLYHYQPPVQ